MVGGFTSGGVVCACEMLAAAGAGGTCVVVGVVFFNDERFNKCFHCLLWVACVCGRNIWQVVV